MTLSTFTVVCTSKQEGNKITLLGLGALVAILNGGK